ncbi:MULTISPECIES: porin [Rhizobium]|uniref:Porin n=1 Tax=Rhizobium laguerreae TaxID=1076926 RepID=A0A6N9ZR26_9HYPH|nr:MULTISPECIES: porin [Rhizobium]NEH95832.1 porin [Rhizobium laguerreae]NKL07201.1 porin [Rhizobium leguminosarum bv. viciae]NKL87690.1 porin [Rhizobium leguminosarum bv. viciae]NKL89834.1 porin [Rhizobium leguminosarum bv. viciae]NKM93280.1 porin [Rhizobium leguminosarum bv. viciae]
MNIKSLLLGSAAALAVVSGAQAADAIVAAEPEPVEYVRVCDAYGTGYFYIPGTETCLKINGYIRFQVNVGDNPGGDNDSDWDAVTRGQVQFTAKSDTEYGPLTGVIVMQFNADNASDQESHLDSAYLDVAGFRAGLFYSWWDDGLSGETDDIGSVETLHNSIRYQYETGDFYAGISVDELEDGVYQGTVDPVTGDFVPNDGPNNVGVAVGIGGKAGAFSYQVTAGYDVDNEDGAVRAMGTVDIGPGTLGLAGVYSSGPNSYYSAAEWAVAAEYAIKATDKLKITPGVQYYGNYFGGGKEVSEDFDGLGDAWKVGLTVDYQIVDNFYAKASVQYLDPQDGEDSTSGYFRLQRAF